MVACALATTSASAEPRRHTLYVELLGKGGTWGLGYDYQLTDRWRLGAVGSANVVDGERLLSFTPYLAASILKHGAHSWYVDGGPHIANVSTMSPVPEWHGASSTGVGFDMSTGYEVRDGIVVRVFAMLAVGENGVWPWVGASIGWQL